MNLKNKGKYTEMMNGEWKKKTKKRRRLGANKFNGRNAL